MGRVTELLKKFEVTEAGKKAEVVVDGRKFETLVFNSVDDANKLLAKNKDYGVIAELGKLVHVAKNDDKGVPVKGK